MQQTDKHGPATDEAIKDPRAESDYGYKKDARPLEDDAEVTLDERVARPDVDHEGTAGDIRDRSQFATFLNPSGFPATGDELLQAAADNDAPQWVRDALASLPSGGRFATTEEVWEATQQHGSRPGP